MRPWQWMMELFCVRADSRGAGWSPGFMQNMSPREVQGVYNCIEWAGTQEWSNGKVGMLGISYFARNQWRVAAMHPPHLAAIIPWEEAAHPYRDSDYHGGILSEFQKTSSRVQVARVQYGCGDKALKNPNTGESAAGPSVSWFAARRSTGRRENFRSDTLKHRLLGAGTSRRLESD